MQSQIQYDVVTSHARIPAVTQVAIDFQRKRLQSTIAVPSNRKLSTYDGRLVLMLGCFGARFEISHDQCER